ncbi:MAG: sigma-54 interaction domain-containing protein [Thermodesulfobacteriota bacterium]
MDRIACLYITDEDLAGYIRAVIHHYAYRLRLTYWPDRGKSKGPGRESPHVIIANLNSGDKSTLFDILGDRGVCPYPTVLIYEREQALDPLNLSKKSGVALLKRPFTPQQLVKALQRVCPSEQEVDRSSHYFFGEDRKVIEIREKIQRISRTDITVLVQGESGTGKEIVARLVHERSPRNKEQFIKVNGAAIPGTLLESELFGYEKGAFTGAYCTKPGKFDLADKGTLFLDEVGDIPLPLQSKLLQVLQNGEFSRLGGKGDVCTDVRVIAATNADLPRLVEQGRFRSDLYYRLNVAHITVPPFRDRKGDLPLLKEYFLEKYCAAYNKPYMHFSKRIMDLFSEYSWPGNVRELENIVKNIVVLENESVAYAEIKGRVIGSRDKNDDRGGRSPAIVDRSLVYNLLCQGGLSLKKIGQECIRTIETEAITACLEKTMWNRRACASQLKISYKSLLNKMQEYGIHKGSL